jgi:S1-C subfamily serine protease
VKKPTILAVLIVCFFLIQTSFSSAATSTYENYAESLSDLGVFVGTGSGFELDRAPTRVEGLVMLIRLLGAENEAKAMQGHSIPFNDVPKWATGYVAYAYENELTNGISQTQFGSANKMEAKAFLTFLLRSLGYNDQSGDFSYNNALNFSRGINLISDKMSATLSNSAFLRAHVAKTAYDALNTASKGSNILLIDKLMAENKIDKAIGEKFKKTKLSEPEQLTSAQTGAVTLQDNLNSVVMLKCYGPYSDEYGSDIGSGVILSPDGKIVTNYHVLKDSKNIDVVFNDGSIYNGAVQVLDYNKDLDLAILKIDMKGLNAAVIGNSGNVKAGDPIKTIGSPYGYMNTVTEGIVSGIRDGKIQVSAAINPGNSGGALFDSEGKLVGITSSMLYVAENMGFAVPINELTKLTGNQMISVPAFYAKNTPPLPSAPSGLSLIYETKTTVLLKWNPVSGADYYYLYCKTGKDEAYEFLDGIDKIGTYGYLAVDLTPGEKYSFKITSEKDDRESLMSTELTFVKSSGNLSHGSFNLFYNDFSGIPDFGKLSGITPSKNEASTFVYNITDLSDMELSDYGYLLEDCDFHFYDSSVKFDGSRVATYRNTALGKTVTLEGSGNFLIVKISGI